MIKQTRAQRFYAALILLSCGTAASAQQSAPFAVPGRGSFAHLQQAVDAIGAGVGEVVVQPGTYAECAVQSDGVVTYRAAVPGRSIFNGGICEQKAALVLRGHAAKVDGLIFQHMSVPDGNGAGIRLEKGDLFVSASLFRDSQQGILANADPAGAISIVQSTFSGLGRCDGGQGCAHSIYIGEYGSLTVRNSRFEAGTGGHYVKSRARIARIVDNSFDDSRGHATNYMIDLSNGGTGEIIGNVMVQGVDKENHSAFIAVGAEGANHSANGLTITNNSARFVPGLNRSSTFVADWTGARITIGTNDLGPGIARYEKR